MEGSVAALEDYYYGVEADHRPSSLVGCAFESAKRMSGRHNGTEILPEVHREFVAKQEELEGIEQELCSLYDRMDEARGISVQPSKITRKKRSVGALRPYYIADDGSMHILHPTETQWYKMYVNNPHAVIHVPKFVKQFRRRFRMPHPEYTRLLGEVSASSLFDRWKGRDGSGRAASPMGLLLLGTLRYLGRGLTFDDLEEDTSISEEVHRVFLHQFLIFGSTWLYPLEVRYPTTAEEYRTHQLEFDTGGLNGAGFSTDGTHVLLWNCAHNLRQAHLGFKESHPARAYNLTTNHRREILHTTGGHPSRWNDKTLALFDEFLSGVHAGTILQDVVYELCAWSDGVGSQVVKEQYAGAWGITDNGYHRWSCTQAPAKCNMLLAEQRLSDWLESFRKDSECVFGILKGRWRCLKTGIRLYEIGAADRMWKTCCALHNRLLRVDGLSEPWEGSLGENDVTEMRRFMPFALRRLSDDQVRRFGDRNHERESDNTVSPLVEGANHQSVIRPLIDDIEMEDPDPTLNRDEHGRIYTNSMSYDDFRSRLVTHFDIMRRKNMVRWPQRES